VARILLTNRNHVRAANRVRLITKAPTAIHPADAAYARTQGAALDDELQLGEKIGPLVSVGSVVDDPPRLRESVRKLLDLDFDALLVGDGQPVLQAAKARLVDLVHTLPK
jgi:hypothetical protein